MEMRHKVVLEEGTWNGTYYPWEEIAKMHIPESTPIFDSKTSDVNTLIGEAPVFTFDEERKTVTANLEFYEDIGPKKKFIGISPCIDIEPREINFQRTATDICLRYLTLVLDPCNRRTILG